MVNTTSSFGIGAAHSFAQQFPALSAKLAQNTASETGLDAKDPMNVVSTMHSKAFTDRVQTAADMGDTSAIDQLFTRKPNFASPSASVEDQTAAAFDEKEATAGEVMGTKGSIFKKLTEADGVLAELSNFNKDSYKKKRMQQLNPTEDIDKNMLELQMQAFTARSMLETDPEIMALPPALQARAIASKMQVFSDTIQTLKGIRDVRASAAESQIDEEIGARDSQINVATSRIAALDRQMSYIESAGGDKDALASLRLDRIQEMERLRKMRSKSGGESTQKEFVYNALLRDFQSSHGNRLPSAAEEDELKRQASTITTMDADTLNRVLTGNTTVPSMGTKQVETPVSYPFGRINPMNWRGETAPTEVTTYDTPASILRTRGYGVPLSDEENVQANIDYATMQLRQREAAEKTFD